MPYICNTCGEEFENRSLLGKHIYNNHRPIRAERPYVEPVDEALDGKVIIPVEAAPELQWVANGMPIRLDVLAYKRPEGAVIEDVKLKL